MSAIRWGGTEDVPVNRVHGFKEIGCMSSSKHLQGCTMTKKVEEHRLESYLEFFLQLQTVFFDGS